MNIDAIIRELRIAANKRPSPIAAHTFVQRHASFSQPVWLQCDDNNIYVVKGRHAGRSIFNDQIIARLGRKMHAPVGEPALVMIPEDLQRDEPQLQDIQPGIAHGSLWIRGASDRQWLTHTDKVYNRPRFALLAVMYGWLQAGDRQLIYSNQEPHLVYSVDHGHFFPNGPDWTIGSLSNGAATEPDAEMKTACGFTEAEIKMALDELRKISISDMIEVVAIPPDEWGVAEPERAAIVEYLATRQDRMLNSQS